MLAPTIQDLSTGAWSLRSAPDAASVPTCVPRTGIEARVPGSVHADLIRAGVIVSPDQGAAELDQFWIARNGWEYCCAFDVDTALLAHDRADLVFECLDTVATVRLNGVEIGRAASAFFPHRFEARRALRPGRNELTVVFTAPLVHAISEDRRLGPLPRNGDWDPFNCIRKPASDFGWDWGPKTATSGIAGPVRLEGWSYARLDRVRALVLRDPTGAWSVEVNAAVQWTGSPREDALVLLVHLETRAPDEGPVRIAQAVSVGVGSPSVRVTVRVTDPPLWWPRGYGDATLHPLRVCLQSADASAVLGTWESHIGFRTVDLDTSPDGHGERFALRINGREVFCTGANLVPLAPLEPSDRDARGREAISGAVRAGMNMLRVWGGGRYENDEFYRECDRAGILVWQDFMFACALYAEEEPLRGLIEHEARYQVERLSKHPSVVLWCGGNETVWGYQRWGWKERVPEGRTWGAGYWTSTLRSVVIELDPTRPYWPNSPWSGSLERDVLDFDRGDRHTWDAEFEGYRAGVPRLLSEFGRQGPPTYATLVAALGEPALRVGSVEFEHRQRATGGTAKVIDEALTKYFGQAERAFDEWHYLAQVLQARAVAIGTSWARCNRPRCSGVLVWQLNDVWACPSWSLVDSGGRAKPACYSFRRAAEARACFFHGPMTGPAVYAVNDHDRPWNTEITVRRLSLDGEDRAHVVHSITVPPRTAVVIAEASALVGPPADPRREILVVDYPAPHRAQGRDTWLFAPDRELVESPVRWQTRAEALPHGTTRLWLECDRVARDVVLQVDRLDPRWCVDHQMLTILPGEVTPVTITGGAPTDIVAIQSATGRPPVLWTTSGLVGR